MLVLSSPCLESAVRYAHYQEWLDTINQHEGGYEQFSKGFLHYGFLLQPNNDILYREWAPGVTSANLIGDFSTSHPLSETGMAKASLPQTTGVESLIL
jgi:1,4-alpha-glucan branching enzyme